MYHAKTAGRNNYQFFRAEQNDRAVEHRAVDNGLRWLWSATNLWLHYQPTIHLARELSPELRRCFDGVTRSAAWSVPRLCAARRESAPSCQLGRWSCRSPAGKAHMAGLLPVSMRIAVKVSPVECEIRACRWCAGHS